MLGFDCSDPKQTHDKHMEVKTINDLLNTKNCPSNVTLVNNSHISETASPQIGLCPFELVINYVSGREPAFIVEAKCTNCLGKRCHGISKCEEITVDMNVTYSNDTGPTPFRRSIGCFCTSRVSKEINTKTPPYSRRR